MPPMGERMAAVETGQRVIIDDLAEVKSDVKKLVAWMSEERGARRQRQLSQKQIAGLLTLMSGVVGFILKVVP